MPAASPDLTDFRHPADCLKDAILRSDRRAAFACVEACILLVELERRTNVTLPAPIAPRLH